MFREFLQRSYSQLALSLIILLTLMGEAEAEQRKKWSLTPFAGVFAPSLRALNNGEFNSPLTGTANVEDPDGAPESVRFRLLNPLPKMGIAPLVGIGFQWDINKKNSLLLGGGSWEQDSKAKINAQLPFQGILNSAIYERRAKLSFNQIYIGWQYNILSKPKRYKLYTRLSINEFFDIDYREDLIFTFQNPGEESFKRIMIMESEATGLLMAQFGLGGEFFLLKWLSIGVESGYLKHTRQVNLKNTKFNHDFLDSDRLDSFNTPIINTEDGVLYRSEDDSEWKSLKLGLDGWTAIFKINIYFK